MDIVSLEANIPKLSRLFGVDDYELEIPRFLGFLWVHKDKNQVLDHFIKTKSVQNFFSVLDIRKREFLYFY
jgi:hypothetical protein